MEYTVQLKIDGWVNVKVDADSVDDAKSKAHGLAKSSAFNLDILDFATEMPLRCVDENGNTTVFDDRYPEVIRDVVRPETT